MNVVGGESNSGQQRQTGGRSRRRNVADLTNARSREAELINKPATTSAAAMSVTIVVDDEDDDVLVSSPRSFAQAKSNLVRLQPRRLPRQTRVQVQDDPLELRLGPGGPSAFRIRSMTQFSGTPPLPVRRGRPVRPTIDLTTPSKASLGDDCVVLPDKPLFDKAQSRKRKEIARVEPPKEVEKEKELKLMCAICLDSMKMESSTVCGHIFCQSCIRGAISAQKKCPTCRRKLAMKDVHRIYIQSGVK